MDQVKGKHFRAHSQPWSDSISLYATQYTTDSKGDTYGFMANLEWVQKAEASDVMAFAILTHSEAQELMDSLWQAGMRPTEGKGSAGQLTATEKHLEDMREIAYLFMSHVNSGPSDKKKDENN